MMKLFKRQVFFFTATEAVMALAAMPRSVRALSWEQLQHKL